MIRTYKTRDTSGNRYLHGGFRHRVAQRWSASGWSIVYDREREHFKIFRAKGIVLATGGIGKAYKITSNSWDCTGDGHSLAYHAGAALIDMEYVQFHPTGMVRAPSVAGMLVTEGVRGEGGILTNADGKRFMFDFIPDNYKAQTADNEEEAGVILGRQERPASSGVIDSRSCRPVHSARDKRRAGDTPRRRVSRYLLDQEKTLKRGRAYQTQAAEHASPVQSVRRHRHH